MVSQWEAWHTVILTTEQIKSAIGDRLLACHTSERKRKLKEAASTLDEAGGKDNDNDINTEIENNGENEILDG